MVSATGLQRTNSAEVNDFVMALSEPSTFLIFLKTVGELNFTIYKCILMHKLGVEPGFANCTAWCAFFLFNFQKSKLPTTN